ncbi:MAG TPA: LysE family transporter [Thermoanaerobaculia bacterium]|nr:LysE family transporter [Thermoanaerobaculia bacterium]HUM28794.1 LysE family transporter [Thermoanaerobaculia bacterium]HXK69051.1 LysE family transporter [Thermoanaerobaculia bacterium]
MIDLDATITFIAVTLYTPGPNNILCASLGALYGYRRTVPFIMGAVAGFWLVMALCAFLAGGLNRLVPGAVPVLKYVGAGYILWLAWGVYQSSGRLLEKSEEARPLGFLNGFALQFVNPKVAFFGLTLFSLFLSEWSTSFLTLLWVPILLALVGFSANAIWAFGGQAIMKRLGTPGRARALGVVLSSALVYIALDLADLLPW